MITQSINEITPQTLCLISIQGINPSAHPQKAAYYLKIYVAFSFSVMFANVLRNIAAVWGSYRASKQMHARLLDHVLLLPMAFFDSQPLGRLLNRFTKDTEAVDVELYHLVGHLTPPLFPPPSPNPAPQPPTLPEPRHLLLQRSHSCCSIAPTSESSHRQITLQLALTNQTCCVCVHKCKHNSSNT